MASKSYVEVKHKQPYSIKNAFLRGTVAVCVVTSGFSYVTHFLPKVEAKALNDADNKKQQKEDAKANFINIVPTSYTKPKPYAKSFVISAYTGDGHMKKEEKMNKLHFFDQINDYYKSEKVLEEEIFEFDEEMEFIPDTPNKYNYSIEDTVIEYDTTKLTKNTEMYEF